MYKIIDKIERETIGFKEFFVGVFVIATLRNIIETISKKGLIQCFPNNAFLGLKVYFLHYNSFWFLTFVLLSLLLYFFTFRQNTLLNCFKIGLFAMFLILFPVLFDMLFGYKEQILYPQNPLAVLREIPNFLNPTYEIHGITPGMRYEITIVALLSGGYIFLKTKRALRAILGVFAFFFIILSVGLIVPTISQLYENGLNFQDDFSLAQSTLLHTGNILERSTQKISAMYIVIILCLLSLVYYLFDSIKFKALVANLRITRLIHYLLLFFGGLLFTYFILKQNNNVQIINEFVKKNPFEYFGVFVAALSVFLSFQSAVVFNDIFDFEIDKVSNKNRPLITGIFNISEYQKIGQIFLFFALTLAICINEAFFLLMLSYNAMAFLYSNPPFRLRKVFLLSNLILAIIAITTFYAGVTLLAKDFSFKIIPQSIPLILTIGYIFATMIKDIKDTEGDRKGNVKTLSTFFGQKQGGIITATLISTTIIFVPFLLNIKEMLFISIMCAILFNIVLFLLKKRKELLIFAIYYIYLTILFCNFFNI